MSAVSAFSRTVDITRSPLIERFVANGHLRYWVITTWALTLATEVELKLVVAWYAVTVASGLVRSLVEHQARSSPSATQLRATRIVATLSCVAWAAAPALCWFEGRHHGPTLAAILLCAGFMLVFTQMRAAPKEAVIISIPYTIVGGLMTTSLWGQPGFWALLSAGPVLAAALLIKVVITRIKDRQQDQLIADLEAARDQANAASEAKSAFLAVISHELRTPLNGVLGAAQLLEMSELGDREKSYVSIIRKSGDGLLMTLNDILDMTKVEAGRLELSAQPVPLEALQERLVGPFRSQAEVKGLEFVLETTGDLPTILRLDPLRAGQVIHNLLGNAIKFTDAGKITLSLAFSRTGENTVEARFSVTDTGEGIAPPDMTKLFEPFTQVDDSSTRRFGGTGLGLSIARKVAALFGGDITVQSALGAGSCFTFSAPLEVLEWGAMDETENAAPCTADASAPLSVLIVEDHPVNRMILEAWLASEGHFCATAEHGEAALEQAAVQSFDLIIMDVNMPVMDGLTATRHLRADTGANQHTPIVVLSASARAEDQALGFDAGADAYITKPIDFDQLAVVLCHADAGREAVRDALPKAA